MDAMAAEEPSRSCRLSPSAASTSATALRAFMALLCCGERGHACEGCHNFCEGAKRAPPWSQRDVLGAQQVLERNTHNVVNSFCWAFRLLHTHARARTCGFSHVLTPVRVLK